MAALKTWDKITDERIAQLHPAIQMKASVFINTVQKDLGIKLRVIQGLRTIEDQNAIYAQGRTAPGKIVSNAKGGYSYHNYGLAIDVAEIKGGIVIWETNWRSISTIAKALGFEWGGDFKSLADRPHFQYTMGHTVNDLLAMHEAGQTTEGYINLA